MLHFKTWLWGRCNETVFSIKMKEDGVLAAETKLRLSQILANDKGSEIPMEKLFPTCLFFSGREEKAIILACREVTKSLLQEEILWL